ncbi:hypothetical protein [Jiulongibacter sediminis]|uniref:hypothetical protein n=1 Tax=Jiulongibacter sediminis TaxID=1605367 RepID=UPI0026F33A19|nr:hypothetical protein [Jiulongibacter sediminis]
MKIKLVLLLFSFPFLDSNAQEFLDVAGGNASIVNTGTTKLEILSKSASGSAGVGFGDDNTVKAVTGYSGGDDLFKINHTPELTSNHLTIDNSGMIGLNSVPANARLFIKHNSTSGLSGSAHLEIQETGSSDFARLKFTNEGNTAQWTMAARSEDGSALLNFFYNDGTDFANILSLDGDLFRVGIRQTEPEAYLHIRQVDANVDALILENDDQTGGEKWGLRIEDDDLEFRFEGDLRAYISSATGAYTAVPPVSSSSNLRKASGTSEDEIMNTISQFDLRNPEDLKEMETVLPGLFHQAEGSENLLLDYSQLNVISLSALKKQKALYENQMEQLIEIDQKTKSLERRLAKLEETLKRN